MAFELPEHQYTASDAAVYACPNDELDFARTIANLMDDPDWAREVGAKGRDRIETTLAWSYQAKRLREAYDTLMAASFSRTV